MSVREVPSPWFVVPRVVSAPRLRLFCLPYAGGGTQTFRGWASEVPPEVELCALQLPGRERRLAEAAYTDLHTLVEAIAQALDGRLDCPFAILGHSMGAVVGFELARFLRRERGLEPEQLFVSGRRAPQVPDPDPPMHVMPDDELIAELKRLNGTPQAVFESPELLELVLPTVRADCELCETYVFPDNEPPLDCPISAYGGLEDEHVERESLEAWGVHTNGQFIARMFPGDHFFIETEAGRFVQTLNRDLRMLGSEAC